MQRVRGNTTEIGVGEARRTSEEIPINEQQRRDTMPDVPRSAVLECRDITRRYAHTFYFGSLLMDQRRRAAIWAVYAACRMGDNIVDENDALPVAERRARLDAWWEQVQAAYRGETVGDTTWSALSWAVATYPIPLSAFEELYQGFLMDLAGSPITSMDDLELYCRRVGGVIGFMVSPICGYRGGEDTLNRALLLGQAMQLTNILRDVGEDLVLDRIYLPHDYLKRFDCDRTVLERGKVTPGYQAMMEELVLLARCWYREARPGIARLHGPARLGIAVAAIGYEGILDSIEKNSYDNFSRRAFVSRRRKLALVPTTLWNLRVNGGFGT